METECYRIIRDLTRQTDLVKKNAQSDAKTQDAGLTSDLAFICGEKRQPLTKESFGNCFREACRKAGIDKSAQHVPQMQGLPWPNCKQFSDGQMMICHLFIPAQQTGEGLQWMQSASWKGTKNKHLCPHFLSCCPHLKNIQTKTITYKGKIQ